MKGIEFTEKEIISMVSRAENELLTKSRRNFTYELAWKNNFPEEPGVYMAFENEELIYIGQTAELKSRMSDMRRTYNHTLRKKIGLFRLNGVLIKNKFSEKVESQLTNYMVKNISFTFLPVHFGRLEIESRLVKKYESQLLNSRSVRGISKTKS